MVEEQEQEQLAPVNEGYIGTAHILSIPAAGVTPGWLTTPSFKSIALFINEQPPRSCSGLIAQAFECGSYWPKTGLTIVLAIVAVVAGYLWLSLVMVAGAGGVLCLNKGTLKRVETCPSPAEGSLDLEAAQFVPEACEPSTAEERLERPKTYIDLCEQMWASLREEDEKNQRYSQYGFPEKEPPRAKWMPSPRSRPEEEASEAGRAGTANGKGASAAGLWISNLQEHKVAGAPTMSPPLPLRQSHCAEETSSPGTESNNASSKLLLPVKPMTSGVRSTQQLGESEPQIRSQTVLSRLQGLWSQSTRAVNVLLQAPTLPP